MWYRSSKKVLALVLCVMVIATLTIGCGKSQKQEATPQDSSQKAPSVQQSEAKKDSGTAPSNGPEPLDLPISSKPITLSFYVDLDPKVSTVIKNMGEIEAFQEMEKLTGIKIEFKHPPMGQEQENFNLMLASGQLPDIIHWDWKTIPGGPDKMIEDGYLLKLNDYMDKYAPNLTKLCEEQSDYKKEMMTDKKNIYYVPNLRKEKPTRLFEAFTVRKDWLEKLGLKEPITIDEWYTVLKAFKEQDPNGNGKADEIPFISQQLKLGIERFTTGWGINYGTASFNNYGYFQVDGKVKFGPTDPAYKEYLATMSKWYKEGLIDPDFLGTDSKAFDAKVTSGVAGAFYGKQNGNIGKYAGLMKDKDPNFNIWPMSHPATKEGKVYNFNAQLSGAQTEGNAISAKTKYPKEAMKWLDFQFSEKGIMLTNFGIEGKSYTMVNGKPQYTDLVRKDPNGLSLVQALSKYSPAGISSRSVIGIDYWNQVMDYPAQRAVQDVIGSASQERVLPEMALSGDDATKFANIMNEVGTYVEEMTIKFILGDESIDNFDKYLNTLKSMKVDEAISIMQSAYERYQQR